MEKSARVVLAEHVTSLAPGLAAPARRRHQAEVALAAVQPSRTIG